MKVTINHRTNYSKSPVLIFSENNGENYLPSILKLALNNEGEIYRILEFNEQPEECSPFEMVLSQKTITLYENWKKYRKYSTPHDLAKLDIIQKYYIKLAYGSIYQNPIYKIDTILYYPALTALENFNELEKYRKERVKAIFEITNLKNQLRIVQAKLKVPKKMTELNCTKKQALAYVLGGKLQERNLNILFETKIIHPNSYTGKGKYCSKGSNNAAKIALILRDSGIKYITGNDATKGGFSGNFVQIK